MRILLSLFVLAWSFLFSEEPEEEGAPLSSAEQIASLTQETPYLIANLISPLSGQVCLTQVDLIATGAEPLSLQRTYIAPYVLGRYPVPQNCAPFEKWEEVLLFSSVNKNYRGWVYLSHLHLEVKKGPSYIVRLREKNGVITEFIVDRKPPFSSSLASHPYGFTNTNGHVPSGQYDLRNIRFSCSDNGTRFTIHLPNGTIRHYRQQGKSLSAKYFTPFVIEKEILPNGKLIRYQYRPDKQEILIESLSPDERHVYASILYHQAFDWTYNTFSTSSGQKARYDYHRINKEFYGLRKKVSKKNTVKMNRGVSSPFLLGKVDSSYYCNETTQFSPRLTLESYNSKDHVFALTYAPFGEDGHLRVQQLNLPVGENDAYVPAYQFDYSPPVAGRKEGTTTVTCTDGSLIVYHFSKNLFITSIQNYDQHRNLKKEKLFLWNANQWLEAIEERDADHNLLYQKSYAYDPFGNPITEKFSGDITGDGGLQTYITKRTFSQDGKNLLLTEEAQNGKTISVTYLPSTNLIASNLTKDHDRILLREFYLYDDCHNLVQKISDDGSSENQQELFHVTQRRITTYLLRNSAPFLHMPEWIIETYAEAGVEKLLKKTQLIYDPFGHVAEEIVYDSHSNHAYTLFKTYNERGDLLSETNSLGQQANYTYDAKGRKVSEQNFSQRLSTAFGYDTLGRLKEKKETTDDQSTRIMRSEYDPQNRLIQTTDRFGNSTHYTYAHLNPSPSKTIYPPIVSDKGEPVSVVTNTAYDSLGRELAKTDANGNTTAYRYNAYGSPIEVLHPDGAKETFRYVLDGTLDRYTDPDGLTIQYQHDVLGRVLSKTYLTADIGPIAEETYTYNGFNLVAFTDKEGNLTQYFYDGAGRKIGEEFCGRKVEYTYDSLGRIQTTIRHNQENTLAIHYQRDLLGRILEETKTDSEGNLLYKIAYSYDADGNIAVITRPVNGQNAVETISYDPFAREVCRIDPLSHQTTTRYDEAQTNVIGQRTLQVFKTDPLNRTDIQTYDALARPVSHCVIDSNGRTLALQEKSYDPHGNLIFIHDHVYQQAEHLEKQSTHYAYNSRNQLNTLMRAYSTPEVRKTGYTYYPSGKTQTKTLPNGTTLSYTYDPFGHLSALHSSDGTIDHAFEYDRLGRLLTASDQVNNLCIQRTVDPFGNTIEERFPSGFQICKTYDDFNRCRFLKTPFAEIVYRYDPLHMRSVEKKNLHGNLLYTHAYTAYDLSNHLLREELIGNLGEVVHSPNLLGQTLSLTSPYYAEEYVYDAVGNTIARCINGKESIYAYDGLDQLISENSDRYTYDSLYNRREAHGRSFSYNLLNELNGPFCYDLNGNLQSKEQFNCTYDPLNQLIEAATPAFKVNFAYDPLGRRLSKTVSEPTPLGWKEVFHENYLYDGSQEIGSISADGTLKNFRILGLTASTVCIELEGKPYAPIVDVQGNICSLIDPAARVMTSSYAFTAFGETLKAPQDQNPWRFASKRLDPELNLVYFGKRYYDPSLGRWTSPDPMGFADSMNLYQYVLNNPFSFADPDGQFIIAIPLLALTWKVVAAAAVAAFVGYELEHQFGHSHSDLGKAFGAAVGQMAKGSLGLALNQAVDTEKKKKPPYKGDELGDDPTKCPGEGFEWRGKGKPGSRHGSWFNSDTGESLHPDLDHPPPKKPHWDYESTDGEKARLNIDGTWEWKQ